MTNDNTLELLNIDWHIDSEDNGLICSKEIHIKSIQSNTEIWINKERRNQFPYSKKQKKALENFLEIDVLELQKMYSELKRFSEELIADNKITKKSIAISTAYKLKFRAVIVPKQNKTLDNYILILADTSWKIKRSNYNLEIEILFKNNQFELLQEYSGLWTRLEWIYDYNTN
ncbi:hypothetical protein J2X31_002182 [Flavobacterium arsenatis]|uniref:Uncharacterized protein n=1 Tax=Flavobacterium arsenatis TaxID=1484332 RepID=A0ABU1TR88_9FLAO|nr:hypothetical protein [Flavobacterium arsenatis]MDR6968167.1 hypothetical protein [Flavobacterium arsenatis]